MMTRPLLLITLLGLGACTSAPEPAPMAEKAVPEFCKTAYEAGPSYTQADASARFSARNAALPKAAQLPSLEPLDLKAIHYPQCALSYDLEGHCDMVFDVLADGTTTNILPICTSRVFEREATYAVSGWTFTPPGDGPRPAVVNRVQFKLGDLDEVPVLPPPLSEPGPVAE
jgi:outer membrane biosynthesis protein TonB